MTTPKARRRALNKKPRAAYCTGCGVVFDKIHLMIQHRNLKRCGGRFLPEAERELLDHYRRLRQRWLNTGFDNMYRLSQAAYVKFTILRKQRLMG